MEGTDVGARIYNEWKSRVIFVQGKRCYGSGVLIKNKRIITAAHLSFTLNDLFAVKVGIRQIQAKCIFISSTSKLDFAILHSDELEEIDSHISTLNCGHGYHILGSPNSADQTKPSIVSGIMENIHENSIHYIGSPGARGGYSGGPVIDNLNHELAGILIGSIHGIGMESTLKDVVTGYYEQKSLKILPIMIIEAFCMTDLLIDIFIKLIAIDLGVSDNES